MSSTDARQQASVPATGEQGPPGGAGHDRTPGGAHAASEFIGGESMADALRVGNPAVAGYRSRRRGWTAALVVVVLVAAGVAGADAAGVFRSPNSAVTNSGYATSTQPVLRGSLTEQTQENGTLGDAGSYTVVVPGSLSGSGGSAASTFTWLPPAGQTIRQGQTIYQVNGIPVVLLYGSAPAYRDLSEGMTGTDVTQLNADLVTLGYATAAALGPRSGWDDFSGETGYALGLLQSHLGLSVTGTLPLGQAVFLPGAIQVTGLGTAAVLGGPATAGSVVLTASSLTRVVTVDLDASLQNEVAIGNKVSVTLPDGSVTPGVISSVSTASSSSSSSSASSSGNSSGSGTATITVVVSLSDPKVAGDLNQAPVEVTITTGSVSNVLIVPVDALLAQPGGSYAVEVTGPGGHRLVTVAPGLFDDAAGTVQVTGNLTPGQRVVVPGT